MDGNSRERRAHGLKWALAALVFGAALVRAKDAQATPSARLVYLREKGTEDCPDETALRAAVAARLGYDPFFPFAKATLFAEVSREAAVYRARVRLVEEGGVVRGARDLEHKGERCADLVEAMALTMSIAIDPRSLAGPVTPEPPPEPPPPPPEPPSEPTPTPATQPPREPRDIASPTPRRTVSLDAHALATGWLGAAPSANVGAMFGAELQLPPFAMMVDARLDAGASAEAGPGRVSTSFQGASLSPCFAPNVFRACPVLVIGRIAARGTGIASPGEDAALHALGGARGGIVVPIVGPLTFRAQLDVLFAFTPQTLRIDGREVLSLDRVSAGIGVGVGAAFF